MQVASGKPQYNIWLRELADVSNKHENLVTTPWGPQADIKMMIISLVKNLREFSPSSNACSHSLNASVKVEEKWTDN